MSIRKIAIYLLVLIVAAVAGLGGLYFIFTAHFNPSPPDAGFAKPANALEAQRQDLEQFRRLVALDRSYSHAARAEADTEIDTLARSTKVLGWGQLRVALMRIAALADNGHTAVFSGDNRRPNAVPLRVSAFADGLYVLRAKAPFADLLGARVEAIDGKPIEDVLTRLDALRGGLPAWRWTNSEIWVQSPEMLNGIGVAPSADTTVWTLRLKDGSLITRTLKGEALDKTESFEEATRWLSPEPLDKEPKSWRAFTVPLPLALRDFNKTFRRAPIERSCILFLQMKAIIDGPDEKIADWLRETADAMAANKPCAVILDLRYNTGGDYTNTWTFTHKLPDLLQPGARVFLLTGPQTFSATITTTAFIKETLGDRAVIVGEPVGDRLKFLSEGNSGCLPNSGICFHYSTGMHDYSAPCTDWRVCYWVNWFYPVRVKTLAPDVTAHLRFADYLAGRDPVSERALGLATGGH
jgi:hypothetical protein